MAENNNITLDSCFKSIINGEEITTDLDPLNRLIRKDLCINLNLLDTKLKNILPFMLVHYIKSWPGWQKSPNYHSGNLTYEVWFERFKRYLTFKINFLIKNDFAKAVSSLKKDPVDAVMDNSILSNIDQSTQCTTELDTEFSPFGITISGTPKYLKTMVFCDDSGDSIIMKQHADSIWTDITFKQLLNWPWVEVTFTNTEVQFTRRNVHEFKTYLSKGTDKMKYKEENVIEEVEIIDENVTRKSYTLNLLQQYFTQLLQVLSQYLVSSVHKDAIANFRLLIHEFLLDIIEIDLGNTMATNTSVLFQIGGTTTNYARNKKIKSGQSKSNGPSVCFSELITPKVQMSLNFFKAVEDSNSGVITSESFKLINQLASGELTNVSLLWPKLEFRCNFCRTTAFTSKEMMVKHLVEYHGMEHPLLCFKCNDQFDVKNLADNRWKHKCVEKSSPLVVDNSVIIIDDT